MIFKDPHPSEVLYVCRNMRDLSRDEMCLICATDDPEVIARLFSRPDGGLHWVAHHEGRPAALFGAYPMHKGVWALYGFGTDDYAAVLGEVTRFARRDMFEAVAKVAHRAQCLSPVSHVETHKWLRLLGAKQEGVLEQYGTNREDVAMFAWTKEK